MSIATALSASASAIPPGSRIDPRPRAPIADGAPTGTTYCDDYAAGGDGHHANAGIWYPGCGWCAICGALIEKKLNAMGRPYRALWFCGKKLGSPGVPNACAKWWRRNHQWPDARAAALRRDRNCRRCHRGSYRPAKKANRDRLPPLEVNHIKPRAGAGYGTGCHNHQENLETLCNPCHQLETKRQGDERRDREANGTCPDGEPHDWHTGGAEDEVICTNCELERRITDEERALWDGATAELEAAAS